VRKETKDHPPLSSPLHQRSLHSHSPAWTNLLTVVLSSLPAQTSEGSRVED
jgi:hypothetical protein